MTFSIYCCVNKRCSEYKKEFGATHFREARAATGKTIVCHQCREVAQWLKNEVEILK